MQKEGPFPLASLCFSARPRRDATASGRSLILRVRRQRGVFLAAAFSWPQKGEEGEGEARGEA